MKSRQHHYLSQCYLKGFTDKGSKKSKLTVYDLQNKKSFETIPRNVGGIRDFNRVDIEGLDENVIEKDMAKFEGKLATALRKIEENLKFDEDTKIYILNLIALFSVRTPQKRENWRKFQAQIAENMAAISLSSKERWEKLVKQLKKSDKEKYKNVTYEDVKEFFESKRYTITVPREQHIYFEFVGIKTVVPLLLERNWLLIKSTKETGNFITTDHPVLLNWKDPEKVPLFYRNTPGFGLIETQVYFPISKNLALIGEFDREDKTVEGTKEIIATLNSRMIMSAYKQVYTPKQKFYFSARGGKILEGKFLLNNINT